MNKTPQSILDKNARYRSRNREAVLYHKRNNRLRRFGLQPEDLTRMLETQNYKCAVCGKGPLLREGRSNLSSHLDHCHECGTVRNLVCKRCNTMLGFIESKTDIFIKAMNYTVAHGCVLQGGR
jgi:ferredoxin-like protein FixX